MQITRRQVQDASPYFAIAFMVTTAAWIALSAAGYEAELLETAPYIMAAMGAHLALYVGIVLTSYLTTRW